MLGIEKSFQVTNLIISNNLRKSSLRRSNCELCYYFNKGVMRFLCSKRNIYYVVFYAI